MADVNIRVGTSADTSGVKEVGGALKELTGGFIDLNNMSGQVLKGFATLVQDGYKKLIDISKESIKAVMEQDRADRQLKAIAGELTDTFKAQASALQTSLGVSEEMVESIQTLALRYGAAPSQVEGLTKAVLDYSAVTGIDAVNATRKLLMGVEAGGKGLHKLGIDYETTGSFTKDLATATAQLGKTFAGGAQADADSMAGRARILNAQIDELKEGWGRFITDLATSTGVIEAASVMVDALNHTFSGGIEAIGRRKEQTILATEATEQYEKAEKEVLDTQALIATMALDQDEETKVRMEHQRRRLQMLMADAETWRLEAERRVRVALGQGAKLGDKPLQGDDELRDEAAEARAEKLAKAQAEAAEHVAEMAAKTAQAEDAAEWAREEKARERQEAAEADFAKAAFDSNKAALKAEAEQRQEAGKQAVKDKAANEKMITAAHKQGLEDRGRASDEAAREEAEQTRRWRDAGIAVGEAFLSGMISAMETIGEGGELDAVDTLADVLGFLGPIVGTIIGSYYGGPAGGQAGGQIGSVAGQFTKWGIKKFNKDTLKKKHDGGWIGERYHEGGWPGLQSDESGAILQSGERVLSRRDVANMGGPGAVDRAARGGGNSIAVTVQAIDAGSFTDYLGGRGGGGFVRTILEGRGELAQLMHRQQRGWAT